MTIEAILTEPELLCGSEARDDNRCAMQWNVCSTDACRDHNAGRVYATVMQGGGGDGNLVPLHVPRMKVMG